MASGGKREGAGRPTIAPKEKRVQISISVDPNTKVKISTMRKDGVKIGKLVDMAVNDACRRWLTGEDLTELK